MRIQLPLKLLVIISFTYNFSVNAQAVPNSMAVIGDSISAGALADFNRTDGLNPFALPRFINLILKFGFQRSLHAMESPKLVWSSGLSWRMNSHAKRLRKLNDDLAIYNAAVSGTNSNDIHEQVNAILNWSAKSLRTKAPDYVTLAIGANDACSNSNAEMTPTSRYSNNVKNAVYKLLDANPKARILLSGIPNVEHLRNIAKDSVLMLVPPASRCKDMWAIHKFCRNMLLEDSQAKRSEITQRIKEYQSALTQIAKDANAKYGADHVRFASQVNNYKFNDREISMDCFHPNKKGQQALSNVSWESSWWKNLVRSRSMKSTSVIEEQPVDEGVSDLRAQFGLTEADDAAAEE